MSTIREQLEAKYGKPQTPQIGGLSVRQQLEAKYNQQAQPAKESRDILPIKKIFTGETINPTFRAKEGGANTIASNVGRTAANIPTAAARMAQYPVDILRNIYKIGETTRDIVKDVGVKQGIKDFGFGLADTGKKIGRGYLDMGQAIYDNLERNVESEGSIRKGVGISTAQGVSGVATAAIEDPLLIPSLIYAPQRVLGKTDAITRLARPTIDTTKKVINPVYQATEKIIKNSIKPKNVDDKLIKLVGEISQINDPKKLVDAKIALSSIDTKGIKNYSDLSNETNKKIATLSRVLDETLDVKKDLYKLDDLAVRKDINGQMVTTNYVDSALDQLDSLYTNIQDPFSATRIRQLKQKATTEGLTVKDINNIAREYGIEFKQKAFSKLGEPLTSVSAQGFENVRSGIKDTARNLFDDPIYKSIDEELSKLYTLKSSADSVNRKVQTLKNRIKERSMGEKVGRLLFQATDLLSLGTLGGFTRAILPRGQGLKVLNALDLEKQLKNNLKQLDKMLDITNKADMEKELKSFIQSQALLDNQPMNANTKNMVKNVDITQTIPQNKGILQRAVDNSTNNNVANAEDILKRLQQKQLRKSRQGGFIKIGNKIVKEIDEPTKDELFEAIKLLDNKPSKIDEIMFDKLVEKFDLNVNGSVASLKKRIETILEKTKTKPVRLFPTSRK